MKRTEKTMVMAEGINNRIFIRGMSSAHFTNSGDPSWPRMIPIGRERARIHVASSLSDSGNQFWLTFVGTLTARGLPIPARA